MLNQFNSACAFLRWDMKSILFVLILVEVPFKVFGVIVVHHKLTKDVVLQIQHEFVQLSFNLSPDGKDHLVISNPIDACTSINPPPKTDIHSLEKGAIPQSTWVLLADDTDCDIHYKIVQAQHQGYKGLIIYSNQSVSPRPMTIEPHLTHLYEVNVSFIGLEDALELKKYAFSKPYVLKIERDWSFWVWVDDAHHYLARKSSDFHEWIQSIKKSSDELSSYFRIAFGTILQVLVLSTPLLFLMFHSWNNNRGFGFGDEYPERENVFRGYRQYTRDRHSNDNNYDDSHHSTDNNVPQYSSSIIAYRKLLGVTETATKKDIESAFRQRSAPYHPDKNRHLLIEERTEELEAMTDMFRKMSDAKAILLELIYERK